MKFNFTVNLEDCYDGYYDIEEEIINKASNAFLEQVIGYRGDCSSTAHKLESKIDIKVDEIMSKDFKEDIINKLIDKLAEKFEKSKQYKELLKGNEVESDRAMKLGLKDMVGELVESKMKNMFK